MEWTLKKLSMTSSKHYSVSDESFCCVLQALELNQANTKALFRRAQAWQGLKEYSKAMVTSAQDSLLHAILGFKRLIPGVLVLVFLVSWGRLMPVGLMLLLCLDWSEESTGNNSRRQRWESVCRFFSPPFLCHRYFPSSLSFACWVHLFWHFMHEFFKLGVQDYEAKQLRNVGSSPACSS